MHGLPGNHYLDPSGEEVQLDRPELLRAPSIHAAFASEGVRVLAVTTKEKLRRLLAAGGVPCVSAEHADVQTLAGLDGPVAGARGATQARTSTTGTAPTTRSSSGSRSRARLDIELLYVSLTDAVQHAAAPGEELSDRYLARLDELVGAYLDAGWRLGLVADHGMNAKTGTRRPAERPLPRPSCSREAGLTSARVVLPITDPYVAHHAALGSACWVHVADDELAAGARGCSSAVDGVEEVLDRAPSRPRRSRCRPTGSATSSCSATPRTVFGKRPADHDLSALRGPLRSHGGPPRAGGSRSCSRSRRRSRRRNGATNADVHALLLGGDGVTVDRPVYEPPCLIGGDEEHGEGRLEVAYPYTGEAVGSAPLLAARVRPPRARPRRGRRASRSTATSAARCSTRVADAIDAAADELAAPDHAGSRASASPTPATRSRARATSSASPRGQALRDDGELFACDVSPNGRPRRAFTTREPVRLVAAITPFNHPLNQVAHKLAPAIAAGAPIVLKPSEKTPLAALWLARAVLEAGYPADALAVVTGEREVILDELLGHEAIEVVMFTGGVHVGELIARRAGYRRVVLELGGNDPLIVLRDADLAEAASLAVAGGTRNSGQRCTAVKRIIVEAPIADELAERIAAASAALRVGDPLDPATDVGTLIDEQAAAEVERRVAAAIADGAPLLHGGERAGAQIVPPVLDHVDPDERARPRGDLRAGACRSSGSPTSTRRSPSRTARATGSRPASSRTTWPRSRAASASSAAARSTSREVPGFRTEETPFGGVKASGLGDKEGVDRVDPRDDERQARDAPLALDKPGPPELRAQPRRARSCGQLLTRAGTGAAGPRGPAEAAVEGPVAGPFDVRSRDCGSQPVSAWAWASTALQASSWPFGLFTAGPPNSAPFSDCLICPATWSRVCSSWARACTVWLYSVSPPGVSFPLAIALVSAMRVSVPNSPTLELSCL